MKQLKFMLKNRKHFTSFIYLLIIVIIFGSGFLVRPYFKPSLKQQSSTISTPKSTDGFNRIPTYDTFNLGINTNGQIVFENEQGTFIAGINANKPEKLLDNNPINRKKFIALDSTTKQFYYNSLKENTEYIYKKNISDGKEQEVFQYLFRVSQQFRHPVLDTGSMRFIF